MKDILKGMQEHSDHMDAMRKKYPHTHMDGKGNTVAGKKKEYEAKKKELAGKDGRTKTGMKYVGQKYDMHSSDYVGDSRMSRTEIKKRWKGIVGRH